MNDLGKSERSVSYHPMFYQLESREDKMEKTVRCFPGFRSNWVVGANKLTQGGKRCLLGRSEWWASLSSRLGSERANLSSNLPTDQLCFSNQTRPMHAVPLSLLMGKVSIYFLRPCGTPWKGEGYTSLGYVSSQHGLCFKYRNSCFIPHH